MNNKREPKVCLGIDLGTTNSVMSYQVGNDVNVLENTEGNRITPSFVYIESDKAEAEIGVVAKRRASREPESVFSLFKRLIGNKLEDVKHLQLNYKLSTDDKGMVQVLGKGGKAYSPIFLSSRILKYFKDEAEKKLGCRVDHAVITVPAYFNNSQREATKAAGELAGFKVERIINEPTAAALAAGSTFNEGDKVLVYDLGGGTFDISLVEKSDGVMQVLGQDGNTQLGGADFDQILVEMIEAKVVELTGKKCTSARSKFEVREAAENVKKQLSSKVNAEISIPFLGPEFGSQEDGSPFSLEMQVSRVGYQQATKPLIDRTVRLVNKVLKEADITANQISKVILVGGMTRDLQVQESLSELFGKDRIVMQHNPDEVVSIGAAIQGAILLGTAGQKFEGLQLLDATPLSLGIETLGGRTTVIIPKNTSIPVQKSQEFSTAVDNQTSVKIMVVQGERPMASDNHNLGAFELVGIESQPRGIPRIEVSFDINANGIVVVSAKDLKTGKKQDINIDTTLGKDEIKKMTEEAERFQEEDEQKAKFIDLKVSGEQMTYVGEELLKTKDTEGTEEHDNLKASIEGVKESLKSDDHSKSGEVETAIKALEQAMTSFRTLMSKRAEESKPQEGEAGQQDEGSETTKEE